MDKGERFKRLKNLKINHRVVVRHARKTEKIIIRHAKTFITKRLNNIHAVKSNVIIWIVGISFLILCAGMQQIWFKNSYTKNSSIAGGTLSEGVLGQIKTINPLYAVSTAEKAVARLVFSSLMQYDASGNLGNDLASSVVVGDQGKKYTVSIKKDIFWHDQKKLTAEDVVFTVNLMKNTESRTQYRSQWQGISVRQIDEYTVEFSLPSVYAAFTHVLTFPVLPEHILASVSPSRLRESSFSINPIGSGPFQFKLRQDEKSQSIFNLASFENYFKGKSNISRFELHAFSNRDDLTDALKSGQVIAAVDANDSEIKNKNISTNKYPINSGAYAFFNLSRPTLSDTKVRQALASAIDKQKLITLVNEQNLLDGPFVSGQLPPSNSTYQYNLEISDKLLNEAGWIVDGEFRKKDNVVLTLEMTTTDDPVYEKTARFIADSWKKLKVDTKLNIVNPNDSKNDYRLNVLQARAYDVFLGEIAIGADPDVYAFWHSSQANAQGLNLSQYSNGLIDDALSSARTRIEPQLRIVKYQAFQNQWFSDIPSIDLFQIQFKYSKYNSVNAIDAKNKFISSADRFNNILYWTVEKGRVYKTP